MPDVEARCQGKNGLTLTKPAAFLQCWPGMAGQVQGVRLDRESGLRFDLLQEIGGKQHIEIKNLARLGAGEMAVGVGAIAIETAIGTFKAFDHASRLQGFKILINGGVADVATLIVELLKDVPGGKMAFLGPQQIKHHASLATQPHAQITAALIHLFDVAQGWGHRFTDTTLAAAGAGCGSGGGRGGMQPLPP